MNSYEIAKRGPTEEERQTCADQDEDGLLDLEEIRYDINGHKAVTWDRSGEVQLLTIKDCMELEEVRSYTEEAFSQYVGFDISLLNDFKVLPINTDPTMADSDYDKISDVIELEIGTDPLSEDTDGDKLSDYTEVMNYYDPLNKNPDDDNYSDWAEYHYDLDPFSYDMDLVDWHFEFQKGLWLGDFETADTIPALMGQITGPLLPGFNKLGDIRDLVAAVVHHEWGKVAISAAGLVPAVGEYLNVSKNISNFLLEHADDASKVINALTDAAKDSTRFMRLLPDKAVEKIGKTATKSVKITKKKSNTFAKLLKKIDTVLDNPYVNAAKVTLEKIKDSNISTDSNHGNNDNDGNGDDGDENGEDQDDDLTLAIKDSPYYKDNALFSTVYSDELVEKFYEYRDLKTEDDAIFVVEKTYYFSKEVIDELNEISQEAISVFDLITDREVSIDYLKLLKKYSKSVLILRHYSKNAVRVVQ